MEDDKVFQIQVLVVDSSSWSLEPTINIFLQLLLVNPEDPLTTSQLLLRIAQIRKIRLQTCEIQYQTKGNERMSHSVENESDTALFADVMIETESLASIPAQNVLVDVKGNLAPDMDARKVQGQCIVGEQRLGFEFERFTLIGGRISGMGVDGSDEYIICGGYDACTLTFQKKYLNGARSMVYTGNFRTENSINIVEGNVRECDGSIRESSGSWFVLYLPKPHGRQVNQITVLSNFPWQTDHVLNSGFLSQSTSSCCI